MRRFAARYLAAVPDLHHEIEDWFAEEDSVVSRDGATHRGEMMDIAPTGQPITFSVFLQHRIAGGKIVEEWACTTSTATSDRWGRWASIGRARSPPLLLPCHRSPVDPGRGFRNLARPSIHG